MVHFYEPYISIIFLAWRHSDLHTYINAHKQLTNILNEVCICVLKRAVLFEPFNMFAYFMLATDVEDCLCWRTSLRCQ